MKSELHLKARSSKNFQTKQKKFYFKSSLTFRVNVTSKFRQLMQFTVASNKETFYPVDSLQSFTNPAQDLR